LVVKDVTPILKALSKITPYSYETIKAVYDAQYADLWDYLRYPKDKAAYRVPGLGTFYIRQAAMYRELEGLIKQMRLYPDSQRLKDRFRDL